MVLVRDTKKDAEGGCEWSFFCLFVTLKGCVGPSRECERVGRVFSSDLSVGVEGQNSAREDLLCGECVLLTTT